MLLLLGLKYPTPSRLTQLQNLVLVLNTLAMGLCDTSLERLKQILTFLCRGLVIRHRCGRCCHLKRGVVALIFPSVRPLLPVPCFVFVFLAVTSQV